jgi:hypothetical protein
LDKIDAVLCFITLALPRIELELHGTLVNASTANRRLFVSHRLILLA